MRRSWTRPVSITGRGTGTWTCSSGTTARNWSVLSAFCAKNTGRGVVIRSWASPDGANRLNEVLSKRRADSLKAYLVRHAGIPDSIVSMHGEGIAWDMLRRMVAASDMLYKKEVLHILDHTPVWVFDESGRVVDGRKKQLMELRGGRPYVYMQENFFPDLRSSLSVACNPIAWRKRPPSQQRCGRKRPCNRKDRRCSGWPSRPTCSTTRY